jgi:probable F420-dependent oxidoreductase
MKLGVALPLAGDWATPENQITVAQRAEALGYHSPWVLQRLFYALAPQNDYPPMPGQPWPAGFRRVSDPIVTLSYVAGATTKIRLGTSVLITAYYTPIMLAKQLATLDRVSRGRLDVGLGIGWSRDEYEASGVSYERRGRRGDEFISCLRAIWENETSEFQGEFYRLPKSIVEPKPVQKPHPPITIGGYGPTVIKRAVTLGDGFNGGNVPLAQVAPLVAQVKDVARAIGRDPESLHVVSRGSYVVHDTPQGKDRRPLWGSLAEIREDVERYAEAGLTELFLEPNFQPGGAKLDRVLAVMEQLAPKG